MIPAPTQQTGSVLINAHPVAAYNSASKVKQDGFADMGNIEWFARDQVAALGFTPVGGPGSFTVDLYGAKLPFTLVLTLNDTSGGYPGTDTEETYDMGPSTPSITLSPVDADHTYTTARVQRRF